MAELASFSEITLILEILPDELFDADYALVDAVGRDAVDMLRQDSYGIESIDIGKKGGFLVAVTMFISTTASSIWANKEVIIADLSGLITLLTSAVFPLVNRLRQSYERRVGKETAAQFPIKFTLEVDRMSVQIEVTDLESAEKVLQLVQRIQASHPSITDKIPQSKLKVRVPNKPKRKKR